MNKKILLLEDDTLLGETLEELLQQEGYEVSLVTPGNEAIDESYENNFDLYVFDINVPEFNGLELLKALKNAKDNTPTIFISALIDLETISEAFKIGAEDYIKKPFFPEELLIRIRTRFNHQNETIYYQNLVYNPETAEIYKDGIPIYLSRMQLELFDSFMRNINKTVTKENIMELTSIRTVSALRVALTKLKQTTNLNIKNIHGVGYRLETC